MSQYTTLFIAARGTQKENSATKPVVISKVPVTAMFGRVNELHANCLTKYRSSNEIHRIAKRISSREGKSSLSYNQNKQPKLQTWYRWLTGRLETAIHDLHVYIIG